MMKRLFKLLVIILLISPLYVFASGGVSVSPTSLKIEVGSTKTFTIKFTNAIGDASISSSDTSVATVNKSSVETGMVEEGQTKSIKITVNALKEGNATITIDIDAATFDNEDLSGQKRTVTVNVVPKSTTNTTTNTNTNTNTTQKPTTNTTTNTNTNTTVNASNNSLSSLTVDGYELVKVDEFNYTLTVPHDTSIINIKAIPEYSQTIVEGAGEHMLLVGENNIEIKTISESGETKIIKIVVTRANGPFENNKVIMETKESFNIGTHIIALVIGLAIGFGLGLITKKKTL